MNTRSAGFDTTCSLSLLQADASTASARLSGDPGKHIFTNKVTTASGDVKERQIVLIVNSNDVPTIHPDIAATISAAVGDGSVRRAELYAIGA